MSLPSDFKTAKAALRSLVKTALDLPDATPVPEAGGEPIRVQSSRLPMAVLRWHDEAPCGQGGEPDRGVAVKNFRLALICDIWVLFAKTAGTDDTDTAIDLLGAIWSAIWADRRLGGAVTELHCETWHVTGEGPDNPFALEQGEGGKACGITVSFILVEESP